MAERHDDERRDNNESTKLGFDDFGAKFGDTRPPVLTSVTDVVWTGIDGPRPFRPPSVQVGNLARNGTGTAAVVRTRPAREVRARRAPLVSSNLQHAKIYLSDSKM
jgi:hypothetical protein